MIFLISWAADPCRRPSGFDIGRSLVVKYISKVWRLLLWRNLTKKWVLSSTLHRPCSVAHGFLTFYSATGAVLYRNHMVPDRQGSAAHEIPDRRISPSLGFKA